MLALLDRHSFIAICLAVLLEELGVPMPIPTDLLIIFAGVKATWSLQGLVVWFVALNIASTFGASGLYAIVRRGGRPLVDRYGRYVHLGPKQLARAERVLARSGWTGIAVGRAIPGLRYATVIICGLLAIPFRRFMTAHIVGSSVYIAVFLVLGAVFGPSVVERVHVPALWLRLLWLVALGLGLPLLLAWLCYRGHAQPRVAPSRRRTLGAILLASFAGATALAAAWATSATLAELLGSTRPLNVTYSLARMLLGRGLRETSAHMWVYSTLLLLSVCIGALYYELILPLLAPRGTTLAKQALGLAVLVIALVSSFLTPALLATRGSPLDLWWRAGGPVLLLAIAAGILSYALTTAYGRALAIAILPSLRRAAAVSVPPPPPEPPIPVPPPPLPTPDPQPIPPTPSDERAEPSGRDAGAL